MNDMLAAAKKITEFAQNMPPPTVLYSAGFRWLQDLCMAEIIRRGPSQGYLETMWTKGWSETAAREFWKWAVQDSFFDQRLAHEPAVWPSPAEGVPMEVPVG